MPLPLRSRSLLGVEFHPEEVRVVQVSPQGGGWTVTGSTAFRPEPGYLGDFGPANPAELGKALRAALNRAGISPGDAVFGLPPAYCAIRAVSVPPVEGNELKMIVRGEIEMAGLFRVPEYSFDLVKMNDSRLRDVTGRSVLVVGAELPTLENVRATAAAAGLEAVAVEPTLVAMYRGAYLQHSPPPNLILTLTEHYAEISLLEGGQMALHRAFNLGGSIFDPPTEGGSPQIPLDYDAAGQIAIELRRSIDFIARELHDSPQTDEIGLACTHPRASELAQWLQNSLRVRVRLATVEGADAAKGNAVRNFGAYSLALRPPYPMPASVPVVDMLEHENQRLTSQEDVRRKFRIAVLAAALLLVTGGVLAVLGTVSANRAAANLAESKKRLAETQALEAQKKKEAQDKAERLTLLTAQGIDVPGLVRSIVRTMPNEIGLTDIRMTPDGADISGESRTERAFVAMSDELRKDPRFINVTVQSFEKVNPKAPQDGSRFRMQLRVLKPAPITPAPATPPAGGAS